MGVVTNSERAAGGKRNLVKFGPDRVDKFLKTNYHFMILRSHDIVQLV